MECACYPSFSDIFITWPATVKETDPATAASASTPLAIALPTFGTNMATSFKSVTDVLFFDTEFKSDVVSDARILDPNFLLSSCCKYRLFF